LGYEDVYYFSRLFRNAVGMAPSHYRALHQG
jgi:AraC-like DNA-binding protein